MILMDYLPINYTESPEMVLIQQAIQPEIDLLWATLEDLMAQLDPSTADWAITLWEMAFGIDTNREKDMTERRENVIAAIRGNGTVTNEMVKAVAEAYTNGQVEVLELFSENRVELHFVGTTGTPPNLDDVANTVARILPAHLGWSFVIYFYTHEQVGAFTHAQLASYTHHQIKEGEITDG